MYATKIEQVILTLSELQTRPRDAGYDDALQWARNELAGLLEGIRGMETWFIPEEIEGIAGTDEEAAV